MRLFSFLTRVAFGKLPDGCAPPCFFAASLRAGLPARGGFIGFFDQITSKPDRSAAGGLGTRELSGFPPTRRSVFSPRAPVAISSGAESRGITVNYGDSALNRPASETLTTRCLHTRPISVDIAINLLIDEDLLAFVDPNGFSWLSSFFPIV
jgi:hypothetical protein